MEWENFTFLTYLQKYIFIHKENIKIGKDVLIWKYNIA
jgi:hypothetical protein